MTTEPSDKQIRLAKAFRAKWFNNGWQPTMPFVPFVTPERRGIHNLFEFGLLQYDYHKLTEKDLDYFSAVFIFRMELGELTEADKAELTHIVTKIRAKLLTPKNSSV